MTMIPPCFLRCHLWRREEGTLKFRVRCSRCGLKIDELEIRNGVAVVHSHFENPCSRCGSADIHTLAQCSTDTLAQMYKVPGD